MKDFMENIRDIIGGGGKPPEGASTEELIRYMEKLEVPCRECGGQKGFHKMNCGRKG